MIMSMKRLRAILSAAGALAAAGADAANATVKNCIGARFEARVHRSDDSVLLIASSAMSADPGQFAVVSCPTDQCKLAIAPVDAFVTVIRGTVEG